VPDLIIDVKLKMAELSVPSWEQTGPMTLKEELCSAGQEEFPLPSSTLKPLSVMVLVITSGPCSHGSCGI
jgi:hypothetical protein